MSEPLYFENLAVGDSWKSFGRTVTEADVVNFAGMTGDYDPLHVDHEYARQTPFGKPIAHGLLGLAWVAGLSSRSPCVKTVAFMKVESWEFLKPIYVGDTLHAETEVTSKRANGRRTGYVTWSRRLVNQSGDIVQAGVFMTLVSVEKTSRDSASPVQVPAKRVAG